MSSRVQMVIDCFGPTDFAAWEGTVNKFAHDDDVRRLFAPKTTDPKMVKWWTDFSLDKDNNIAKLFAGKAREKAAWASPITYAAATNVPPFLFVHGSQDTWVPLQQSLLLADAMKKNGDRVKFILGINMEHDETPVWPEILNNLKQTLPIEKPVSHQETKR